jgi:hypothetical protein
MVCLNHILQGIAVHMMMMMMMMIFGLSEEICVQQVSIQMPGLRLLRTVAERMKALSSYIVLLANREGTLILKVETPEATVSTHFKNLTVENSGGM